MKNTDSARRTSRFRALLLSGQTEFLLEAHNGISARIGEEAGFKGLWASGLSVAAQFGVRDSNEASWTQVLEVVEFMADATQIPIMLDGDTGYGNFNNMRRLVRKLEQRDVAAVCIEDKLFPKTNSFIAGNRQQLADVDEFCGKIKAGKDAQGDDDFCIVARVEALIAGWGMDEAVRRAEAYHAAGADGILIHSAMNTSEEILEFMSRWENRSPVVIVPTRYYATPTDVYRDAGVSMVIWANHMLRAAVRAMQETAEHLATHENLLALEDRIAPVQEIFRLQGAAELESAEERYLPGDQGNARAIVLAASQGQALGSLTAQVPKAMIEIRGKPLLQHIVDAYRGAGVRDISVVRGFGKERVSIPGLAYVDNDDYEETGELVSLSMGLAANPDDGRDLTVSFGDVLFNRYILQILELRDEDFVIVVDTDWQASVNRDRDADYVSCSEAHGRATFYHRVLLEACGEELPTERINGEWMGFLRIRGSAIQRLRGHVDRLLAAPAGRQMKLHHLLDAMVSSGEHVRVVYTTGHWLDVDTVDDVISAGRFG
ncbi:MAG: phosphoenolpyruvate mutase [Gammaproteobacteria bacterium]|nr:MAG: phosphoenolpyruvate mutase [Gammaproteobacteria bacterium]